MKHDITPEAYAQVYRYAERADGGRSMNESEEALLTDLERLTARLAEVEAERDALRVTIAGNAELFRVANDQQRAELEEMRLTLAAEQGKAEGAPSPRWHWDVDRWVLYAEDGRTVLAIVDGHGGRLRMRNGQDYAHLWPVTIHGTARAAMIAADQAAP